jgi:predicted RNase H-like HicB family nuclease
MTTRIFKVILQFDPEDRAWVSYVPDLENISTYGDSEEEALAHTRELILGYLEAAAKEGILVAPGSPDIRVVDLEVATA